MISIPTIITMVPVTSAGKMARILAKKREKTASKQPAAAVIPKIRLRPPAFPASSDAERKAGPFTSGHR